MEVIIREYFAVKFGITRLFKGKNENMMIITVLTDAVGTRCGYQFALNYEYVVYGNTESFCLLDSGNIAKIKNL